MEDTVIYEITDESFNAEVASSPVPCVIEFTGSWCPLCHKMVPILEQLTEHYGDAVKFCTVNTDTEKALRIKFAAAALPYVVYIADGMKTPLFDEFVTYDRLQERIDFVLNGGQAPTTRPL